MIVGTGIDVGGAHQRLLPESIPLRFFGTAVLAHALAWIGVVLVAEDVAAHTGGPGPVAAAFHLLTVGVLLTSAMGASLQMLPVALGRAAPGTGWCHAVYVSLVVGGLALVAGFASFRLEVIAAGAAALALSLGLYLTAVASVLKGAAGLRLVRIHVWAALACLGLGVGVALLLAIDYRVSLLPDHRSAAMIHMTLVAYGFLGLLALGLSQILIPMFAIAEPAAGRLPAAALALALVGLTAGVAGLMMGMPALVVAAAAFGLLAVAAHGASTERMLAARMRRRLGGEFQLIRLSWLMLAAALLMAAGLALDLLPASAPPLFGFLTLFGWLLGLVIGVQQRILPFLGSMHVLRAGGRPVAPTKLVNEHCLRIHRWCHVAALALVGAGILFTAPAVIRLGGAAGAVGAGAYGLFAITVFQRTRTHLGAAAMPAARTPP